MTFGAARGGSRALATALKRFALQFRRLDFVSLCVLCAIVAN